MNQRIKTLIVQATVAAALLSGAIAVAAETGVITDDGPAHSARPSIGRGPTEKIRVHGKVRGLYPGAVKQMRVRVRNRFPERVRLVSVRGWDSSANATCTKAYVRATRFQGRVPIKPGKRVTIRMRVAMRADAPDSCQGAQFPIRFRARVTKPG
jgi:hypothetical protein